MHKTGMLFLFILLMGMCNGSIIAACDFSPTVTYPQASTKTFALPLAMTAISVRSDLATGTVIYRQNIDISTNAQKPRVVCDSTGHFQLSYSYASLPRQETSSGSKIYQTGVDGVGIQFIHDNGTYFPYSYPTTSCINSKSCFFSSVWPVSSYFVLVKTAENITGGIVSGSGLPVARYSLGQANSRVPIYEIKITGSLTITTPTCNITPANQSMTVPMGSHHVSDFTGKGSGTEWKNASIQLSDCGWFYGNSATAVATFDGTSNTVKALTNNAADITLTPLDGTITAADGIMAIANNASAATGIGIQLSSTQSVTGKINLNSAYAYALPDDGSRTITVPLFARYIQTENSLSAGKANGKLEYTISYR